MVNSILCLIAIDPPSGQLLASSRVFEINLLTQYLFLCLRNLSKRFLMGGGNTLFPGYPSEGLNIFTFQQNIGEVREYAGKVFFGKLNLFKQLKNATGVYEKSLITIQ
jgi:hypothetical protein